MSSIRRFDHVGVTVADLPGAMKFFLDLGLELQGGPMPVEGEFLDTVCGIPDAATEIVMLQAPGGGTGVELSSFTRPAHAPGAPKAMPNELGLRSIAFEVEDLLSIVERLTAEGYELVGGVGEFENYWRMTYVRGPEGIIVALAQRLEEDETAP